MEDRARGGATAAFRNLLLFVILFGLGLVFFLPVRDNTFWTTGDWEYMIQALRTGRDWKQLFASAPADTFQPLVNAVFYLEHSAFGQNAWHYYLSNIFVHALNAWLVYCLVHVLLKDMTISVLSSLLFVFAVGNYGKAVMVVSGISDLLITSLTLLTMIFYVKNETDQRGRVWSVTFLLCVLFFMLSLMSKATSFSIIGCMLAFNMFFREQTGRRVFDSNFVIIAVIAVVILVVKIAIFKQVPGAGDLSLWTAPRTFASYLVRMVFPIQASSLVTDSGPFVQGIYAFATQIRILIFFCIISYSIFGFVFGNKVLRFFIAWTYIMVTPFTAFLFPSDWLNIRHLYLVSVGFSMILASGTVLAARLLYQRPWRRRLPYVIPLAFVLLSQFVIAQLDRNYENLGRSERLDTVKEKFEAERARLERGDRTPEAGQ